MANPFPTFSHYRVLMKKRARHRKRPIEKKRTRYCSKRKKEQTFSQQRISRFSCPFNNNQYKYNPERHVQELEYLARIRDSPLSHLQNTYYSRSDIAIIPTCLKARYQGEKTPHPPPSTHSYVRSPTEISSLHY